MANLLACRLADRIAAVGTVAVAHLPWERCEDFEPTPLIAFHGTADKIIPYEGGTSWFMHEGKVVLESVPAWTAGWAQRNGCGRSPVESVVAADVVRLVHANCESGADVVLYTIEGGGHSWPGHPGPEFLVGHTTDSIDATRELWAFFREHRRESN
jgi:polyhydroxybutyrate depolymerase